MSYVQSGDQIVVDGGWRWPRWTSRSTGEPDLAPKLDGDTLLSGAFV
jgi:hypothetical protein